MRDYDGLFMEREPAPSRGTLEFYRVEDHRRNGPYRIDVDYPMTNGRDQHPLAEQDGINWWGLDNPESYHFGFADLTDLHGWFDASALARLIGPRNERWAFRVTVYTVEIPEQIIHGYRQAIAKRTDLRYVRTINIAELI